MLFNSIQFALFFPLVTVLFFLLPPRLRGPMLLAASAWFYMAFKPVYILILAATIAVDFAAGILIAGSTGRRRRMWLVTSIIANVGVLAFFKYFNFLNDTFRAMSLAAGGAYPIPALDILLPIGLSFHTFQSMSYTIEVYRGRQPAERNPLRFALYVMFYPQLVAGPIERPQNLLPQLTCDQRFDYERVKSGLQLMAWGFFKKIAVADRLAAAVNLVYGDSAAYSGSALLLATYLFAIQIYCDFSGYSDIAIGAAQVMGIRLMKNFERPYFSTSISEFWRRWHISLSTWFRDYVYVPLGGNRVSRARLSLNLMLVFTLSGLWHGPNWTFVVWGALNGLYLVLGIWLANVKLGFRNLTGLHRAPWLLSGLQRLSTFHLILLTWVFFRAPSLQHAGSTLWAIASRRPGLPMPFEPMGGKTLLAMSLGTLVCCELLQSRTSVRQLISNAPAIVRWPAYAVSVLMLLLLGDFASQQRFIYFQF